MPKLCIYCNKHPVFSHKYCKNHQYLRKDEDVKPPKQRSISNTIHSPKTTIKRKYKAPTGELDMFKVIWNERLHVSELSGDKLHFFDINNFHHILHKKSFPNFRLFKPNIVLLTRYEHHQIETMAMSDLIKRDERWANIDKRHQQLKEMYNAGKEEREL